MKKTTLKSLTREETIKFIIKAKKLRVTMVNNDILIMRDL